MARVFRFDGVCEQIVRALELHKWEFPGIEVTFHTYASAGHDYRRVESVEGEDFRLWFGRNQGDLGPLHDTAGVGTIDIPGKKLTVFSDTSASSLHVYVGGNWEVDKIAFRNGPVLDARSKGLPRTELIYRGGHSRSTFLKPYSPLGRNYLPHDDEPAHYLAEEVLREFTIWLRENVLKRLRVRDVTTS